MRLNNLYLCILSSCSFLVINTTLQTVKNVPLPKKMSFWRQQGKRDSKFSDYRDSEHSYKRKHESESNRTEKYEKKSKGFDKPVISYQEEFHIKYPDIIPEPKNITEIDSSFEPMMIPNVHPYCIPLYYYQKIPILVEEEEPPSEELKLPIQSAMETGYTPQDAVFTPVTPTASNSLNSADYAKSVSPKV